MKAQALRGFKRQAGSGGAVLTEQSTEQAAFSSQRAKRAGWPKGLKGPEGAFRPFGPVGVLRRRLLHRNGNFVPLAP